MVQSSKNIFDLSDEVKDEILVDFRGNSLEKEVSEVVVEEEEEEEEAEEDVEEVNDNNGNCVGMRNNLPFMLDGDHNVTATAMVCVIQCSQCPLFPDSPEASFSLI